MLNWLVHHVTSRFEKVKWVVMTFSLVDMYNVLEEHAACVWYPPAASAVCGRKTKSAMGMKGDKH